MTDFARCFAVEVGGEFLAAESVARVLGGLIYDAAQCVCMLAGIYTAWKTLVVRKADRRGSEESKELGCAQSLFAAGGMLQVSDASALMLI